MKYYQHMKEYIKCGEGQGKTSSPPIWFFLSSNLLEEQYTGLYLTSVDKSYVSECVAEGYVDNYDAATADQRTQKTDTPAIVTERMHVIAKILADLIYGAGCEVSLDKSSWWLVWWNWKEGKASLAL
eukprot:3212963-Ditylum_brightwellii.AAC.1